MVSQFGRKPMPNLTREIAAYEAMQGELETKALGKWVVIVDGKLIDIYDGFESAAEAAVRQFGRGPYLVRQIGAPPMTLPASLMYHPVYGKDGSVWLQQ